MTFSIMERTYIERMSKMKTMNKIILTLTALVMIVSMMFATGYARIRTVNLYGDLGHAAREYLEIGNQTSFELGTHLVYDKF